MFLFHSYGHPRDLHSFPTRRSSDLDTHCGEIPWPNDIVRNDLVTALERFGCVDMGGPADRKSTRLNSSHPSISYAVFCLKKKNLDGNRDLPVLVDLIGQFLFTSPHV